MNSNNTILIVDDSETERVILSEMLKKEYNIIEAVNGAEAVAILNSMGNEISLVILDVVMPEMDGFEVLEVMNSKNWIESIPVIMISAESIVPHVERAFSLGVTDFVRKPFDSTIVHRRVINTILIYAKQRNLAEIAAEQIYEKEKNSVLMINILSHIVEFRNGESGLHVFHVQSLTEILAKYLVKMTDKYDLSSDDIIRISHAAALHDVGKVSIPDEIINKPGRLTPEEFAIMKTHSTVGYDMLKNITTFMDDPLIATASEICRWHHERYDGRGYPDGLVGDEIPISAQLVSMADVYDALTSERVYKKAFSHEKAMDMILGGECGAFSPLLIDCLKLASEEVRAACLSSTIGTNDDKEGFEYAAKEILNRSELSSPRSAMNRLAYEKSVHQFFLSVTDNVVFEYTNMPPMLTLNSVSAKLFGRERVAVKPKFGSQGRKIIERADYEALREILHTVTPDHPEISYKCTLTLDGKKRRVNIKCMTTWRTSEEVPVYLGVVGRVVFLD